jgi:hypothetical protein
MVNKLKLQVNLSIINFWLRYQDESTKDKVNIVLSKIFEKSEKFNYCNFIAERLEEIVYTEKNQKILEILDELFGGFGLYGKK